METATFVFSLKQALFDRLRQEVKDPDALAAELWATTLLLDRLGLYTTEVHQKTREEVIGRQQQELLELSIARAKHHEDSVAVMCVDIDDFRLVNDSLGRFAGDEVLNVVAERLREATRETDLVARRSGDTFLLLLADLEREPVRRHVPAPARRPRA